MASAEEDTDEEVYVSYGEDDDESYLEIDFDWDELEDALEGLDDAEDSSYE